MSMPIITPSTTTRPQAISDIIESVALEQTGLSHILNAEGEKIQKVVANGTIDQMMEVNKSVQSMVNTVSRLEMILQYKLELFQDCLCPPVPCTPLVDTSLQTSNPLHTITKNSMTDYAIDLGILVVPGTAGTITVTTIPAGIPISVNGVLPVGVTLVGNILSYTNSNFLQTIKLNVGTGACLQVLTINFISETP